MNILPFIKSPLTFKGSSHFPIQEQAPKLLIRAKSKQSRIHGLITLHHGLLSSIMGSQTPIRQVNSISFSLCAPVSIVPSRQSSTMLTSGQLQILPTTYLWANLCWMTNMEELHWKSRRIRSHVASRGRRIPRWRWQIELSIWPKLSLRNSDGTQIRGQNGIKWLESLRWILYANPLLSFSRFSS